jgi:phosphate transport system substrate-binding protein
MLTRRSPWAFLATLPLLAAGCGGGTSGEASAGELSGTIRIDGSSTVAPLSTAAAELFQQEHPDVRVTVGTSGTGGGFEKFCNGETDISDASRPIEAEEVAACERQGVAFEEIQVANDALSVVVNPQNDWVDCMTVEELRAIWEPESTIDNWSEVPGGDYPNEELELFGAGTDSGTFDYFTEAIVGEEGASRTDYNATEDDNVTVQGVSGTRGALGYLGFSYLEQNPDDMKGLAIDGGQGCVEPSEETVQSGEYTPLGRPLFIYPSQEALQEPEVQAFVEFYIDNANEIAEQALFIPMTDNQLQESRQEVQQLAGDGG